MNRKMTIAAFLVLVIAGASWLFYEKKAKPTQEQPETSKTATEEAPKQTREAAKPNPDSIPAMAEKEYEGSDLKLAQVLDDNAFYTRYSITYGSEGLKISGIMNIPKGNGPFPVLFLNHGYIDPKIYANGQGLRREQDYFARNGYAVLHSDYRGHAFSDPDPDGNVRPRSDYVEDVLNAISAVKKSELPELQKLDKENIGMLGHSMGGGIAINIMTIKPEIIKAFVLLAPISADYRKNFERWVLPDDDFDGIAEKFYRRYGTYEENPETWESFSAKNYFDRVKAPVMLHQGALDRDVPVGWSRELKDGLEKAEKEIVYHEYPLEGHTFFDAQGVVMQRSLEFFDKHLKNN